MIRGDFICGICFAATFGCRMIRRDLASFAPREVKSTWLSQYICSAGYPTDQTEKEFQITLAQLQIITKLSSVHLAAQTKRNN